MQCDTIGFVLGTVLDVEVTTSILDGAVVPIE